MSETADIKQMRVERLIKHPEEIGKLLDRIDEQQEQINLLEKNREALNKWLEEYVDKFTEVWRIVEPYRRG